MSKKTSNLLLVFFFELELKGRNAMGNAKNEKTTQQLPKETVSKEYKEILEYIFKNEKINFSELLENLNEKYDKDIIIKNLSGSINMLGIK